MLTIRVTAIKHFICVSYTPQVPKGILHSKLPTVSLELASN